MTRNRRVECRDRRGLSNQEKTQPVETTRFMNPPEKAGPEEIKSFVTAQRWGTLSTLSAGMDGFPFGSVVPYDIDSQGTIYIYISLIAEHFKNLQKDTRASLTIIDPFGTEDPQAHARATLLLRFEEVPADRHAVVQAGYEKRFPNSINYEIAHNFRFFAGTLERLRWIGGFGDIQWVSAEAYRSASPDPIAYESWSAIEHMNHDHRDALVRLVADNLKSTPNAADVHLVSIFEDRLVIRVSGSEQGDCSIPFPRKAVDVSELREIIVKMLRK